MASLPATDRVLPPIEELVLQRDALLLIDEVVGYGDEWIEVAARLAVDHPLADEQGIPCWVGLELMAQAVLAFLGLELRARGEAPRIGLLLGTRNFQAHAPYFPAGAELRVLARVVLRGEEGMGVFDCTVRHGARELAQANVKGFAPKNLEPYLQAAIDG